MKVLVCGGRHYRDAIALFDTLDYLDQLNITEVIHGAAQGADALAAAWAVKQGARVLHTPCPADWRHYGKPAGMIRNRGMLALEPDMVVAFPGGKGTANMVAVSREAGVLVLEVPA